mmetsp:Transcript_47699/g.137336  ORF Transcript_47699/g.137336 Transcript_47699/m.137336 type:complete len:649 (-) Transcript_47699:75-2021(-)
MLATPGMSECDDLTCLIDEVGPQPRVVGPLRSLRRSRRITTGVVSLFFAAMLVAVFVVLGGDRKWAIDASGAVEDVEAHRTAPSTGCAVAGADCRSSRCCVNGGASGLQCYARDANWAQCNETCTPGVYEGELGGGAQKPSWSCERLGRRSERGCGSFELENECPVDRCEWHRGECMEACFALDEVRCSTKKRCTWNGAACEDACSSFGKEAICLSEQNSKRCEWRDGECTTACWMFWDKARCISGGRCLWHGSCAPDPCSAPGEDCRSTKCCSEQRGGGGMTCFEQNDYYASCSKVCDGEGWSCRELGNRTKTQTNCAWAGEDCASQGLCCNQGFICAEKDQYFTGCIQIFQQTATERVKVLPPPDWPSEPRFVGGGQFEYEMEPASEGRQSGTTLYCFMAYLPGSYEERLVEIAHANNASAFACDDFDMFHTWQSKRTKWDSNASTLTNIDVFIDVWLKVQDAGKWWKYDWTIKVDPDCLIVPLRLKWHLGGLRPPANRPIYVKNTNLSGSVGNDGFLGAVEVFSREALELYFDWWPMCKQTIGMYGGEDGFMKRCMDAMGVGYMMDGGMFVPDNDPRRCKDKTRAAYHPLKIQDNYQCCVDVVNGAHYDIEWGACKDLPSNWTTKVWPNCRHASCRQPMWVEPVV